MKVTEHVEHLLRQGRNPRELIELGFPKQVITKVRRQLREEKADQGTKVAAKDRTDDRSQPQPPPASPVEMAWIQQKLASLEDELHKLETQVGVPESIKSSIQDIEARLNGTPALGLRQHFKCECGASGLVALHIQCTKCGKETRWGWFPEK
jgi:hypothetical protein